MNKCIKGESCIHCNTNYCRFVDEINELKHENNVLRQYRESKQASYESMQKCWQESEKARRKLEKENKNLEKENKKLKTDKLMFKGVIDDLNAENTAYKSSFIANLDRSLADRNLDLVEENEKLTKINTAYERTICNMKIDLSKYKHALEQIRELSKEQLKGVSKRCIGITPMYCVHQEIINEINETIGED